MVGKEEGKCVVVVDREGKKRAVGSVPKLADKV
jgi:hypothetical protein